VTGGADSDRPDDRDLGAGEPAETGHADAARSDAARSDAARSDAARSDADLDRPAAERDALDDELEALLAERRAANPRRSPDREPLGVPVTRRLLWMTIAAVGASTAVLVAVVAGA
jgi:hypothetical protein